MPACTLLLAGLLSSGAPAQAGEVTYAQIEARLAQLETVRAQRIGRKAPVLPMSVWEEVAEGKIVTGVEEVPGHQAKLGWGAAVLDVDLETMWRALNEELYHKDILGMDHVEIVRGKPCQNDRRVLMVMPLPLVSDRWWVVQNSVNTKLNKASGGRIWELRWDGVADAEVPGMSAAAREQVEGKVRITENVGGWFLVDLDGEHTLVEYYALTDPGGSMPAGMASGFAAGTIDKTIETMEDYAKTSTPRCPVR